VKGLRAYVIAQQRNQFFSLLVVDGMNSDSYRLASDLDHIQNLSSAAVPYVGHICPPYGHYSKRARSVHALFIKADEQLDECKPP